MGMKQLTEEAQLVDKQSDCKKLAASNTVNNDKKLFGDNFDQDEWNYYDMFDIM